MFVQLSDTDRIVLRYTKAATTEAYMGGDLLLAYDTAANNEAYVVLWEKPEGNELLWRGSWDSASGWFLDLVGDLEADAVYPPANMLLTE